MTPTTVGGPTTKSSVVWSRKRNSNLNHGEGKGVKPSYKEFRAQETKTKACFKTVSTK